MTQQIKAGTLENVSRPGEPLQEGDRFRVYDGNGNYQERVFSTLPPEGPRVRLITNRAFLARLSPWWLLVEHLTENSAAFRLEMKLLELAGYVDLDAPENLEAFTRLKTAFEQIAGTVVPGTFPEFTVAGVTQDGTEREAYNGPR